MSGCLAERCQVSAYLWACFLLSSIVYPLVVHWTWGGGFLGGLGYSDFAGSGIVHMVGGLFGLVGAKILGPRAGRFGHIREAKEASEFRPHNVPLVVMGTLILWFGW